MKNMILAKTKATNPWTILIILANLIDILSNFEMLWAEGQDNYRLNCLLGLANILLWISVNGYYLYNRNYDKVPITFLYSAKAVFQGFMGILPVCIGVAVMTSIMFAQMFKYKDPLSALFTMFYLS